MQGVLMRAVGPRSLKKKTQLQTIPAVFLNLIRDPLITIRLCVPAGFRM